MKCIYCNNDAKYRERSDGLCPKCRKPFALEPQRGDKFTDGFVKAAVDAVSSQGKVRWNLEHLYFEMWRRFAKKSTGCGPLGCTLVPAALGFFFSNLEPTGALVGAGLGGAAYGLSWLYTRTPRILGRDVFNQAWTKWANTHGVPASMIVPRPQPNRVATESDLGDYSFDRAVICDTSETVDLLLANNFHFENNCAVLSIEGYPEPVFETVRRMLKRNQNLRVWALHDASVAGCKLAWRLKNEEAWFPTGAHIVDVGLRPAQHKPLAHMVEKCSGSVAPHPALSEDEVKWLSKYRLSLAAIRPEQVIKRLFRSFTMYSGSDGGDGLGFIMVTDLSSFSSDAPTSDGGGDSFG